MNTLSAIALLGLLSSSSAFSLTNNGGAKLARRTQRSSKVVPLLATTSDDSTSTTEAPSSPAMTTNDLYIPLSLDEMVKQTSTAMEDAMAQGKNRQIIRILLPRSSDNDQLLQYYERNVASEDGTATLDSLDTKLCPTDETWQGGIMQLYRAASLACQEILR
jgi:hypothetical protein